MQGIKRKIAAHAVLAVTLFFYGVNLQAKQPDECTCWAFGYKAKVVGHTADTAKQTAFFKQCAGLEKNENKIGTESDYWAGWAAAEAKKEIVCPYTESIPTN